MEGNVFLCCFVCAVFFVLRKKSNYGKFQIKTRFRQVWVSGNTVCGMRICMYNWNSKPPVLNGWRFGDFPPGDCV